MTLPSHIEVILSCFKKFPGMGSSRRTWFEARDYCRTIGGDLASFHSVADLKVLKGYSKNWVIRKKTGFSRRLVHVQHWTLEITIN